MPGAHRRPWRPLLPALAASLGLLVLGACELEVQLVVSVQNDGSGVVQVRFLLDAEAVEALGGDVEQQLRAGDLVGAGWLVESAAREDGAAIVTARKPFSRADELPGVIEELSGRVGPFRDFRLERRRDRFRTTFDFTGVVDLEQGLGASALDPDDEDLVGHLMAQEVDVEELRRFLGARVDDVVSFEVIVALPGSGSHDAPQTVAGEPAWRPEVGQRLEMTASSSDLDEARVALAVLGGALLVAAVAVFARWRWPRS